LSYKRYYLTIQDSMNLRKKGRPALYNEPTEVLPMKVPISKKAEIKLKFMKILKKYQKAVALLLLCNAVNAQTLIQRIPDKVNHYTISCNISSFSSIALYKITDRPVLSCLAGVLVAGIVGYSKERFYDGMLGKGREDYKGDFAADIQGAVVGSFFAGMAIALKKHHEIEREYYEDMAPLPHRLVDVEKMEVIQVTQIQDNTVINEIKI